MNATITKTKSAEPMGVYQPSAVDAQKAAAQILFIYAYGNGYDITSKVELPKGRGMKRISTLTYHVTNEAAKRLKAQYTWATDF